MDKWEKRMLENMDFINHLKRSKAKDDILQTMTNLLCKTYNLEEDDMLLQWEELKDDFISKVTN